jgi:hypothetical protein
VRNVTNATPGLNARGPPDRRRQENPGSPSRRISGKLVRLKIGGAQADLCLEESGEAADGETGSHREKSSGV